MVEHFDFDEKHFKKCFSAYHKQYSAELCSYEFKISLVRVKYYYSLIVDSERTKIEFIDGDKLIDQFKMNYNGFMSLSCDPDDLVLGNLVFFGSQLKFRNEIINC